MNVLELMEKNIDCGEVGESGCKMVNDVFEGRKSWVDIMGGVVGKIVRVMKGDER